MQTRKAVAAAATAAVIGLGGLGVAALNPLGVAGAQDTTTTQAPPDSAQPPGDHARGPGMPGLDAAAKAIGVSTDDLRSALEGGQTIAQVAQAHNVDPQTVIDAMVAEATSHLDDLKASLPDRISALVNGQAPLGGKGHGPEAGPRRGPGLDVAANAIGVSTDDLRSALEGGQTIAQVAQAHNVDPQTVIDAMVADATSRLDQAVADGHLTQDEANTRKQDLTQHVTDLVNGTLPQHGPHRRPGPN